MNWCWGPDRRPGHSRSNAVVPSIAAASTSRVRPTRSWAELYRTLPSAAYRSQTYDADSIFTMHDLGRSCRDRRQLGLADPLSPSGTGLAEMCGRTNPTRTLHLALAGPSRAPEDSAPRGSRANDKPPRREHLAGILTADAGLGELLA
jgi:hypothetical protein